jgi:hypothetical protein
VAASAASASQWLVPLVPPVPLEARASLGAARLREVPGGLARLPPACARAKLPPRVKLTPRVRLKSGDAAWTTCTSHSAACDDAPPERLA